MKHNPVLIHADDLSARIWRDADNQIEEADEVCRIGGFWMVNWPEHVIYPQYDSDANWRWIANTINDAIINAPETLSCLAYGDPFGRTVGELNNCGQLYQMSGVPLKIASVRRCMMIGSFKKPVVFHFRSTTYPTEMGGITVVYDPITKHFGVAVCNKKDHFCRLTGRTIATLRAKDALANKYISFFWKDGLTYDDLKQEALRVAMPFSVQYRLQINTNYNNKQ